MLKNTPQFKDGYEDSEQKKMVRDKKAGDSACRESQQKSNNSGEMKSGNSYLENKKIAKVKLWRILL